VMTAPSNGRLHTASDLEAISHVVLVLNNDGICVDSRVRDHNLGPTFVAEQYIGRNLHSVLPPVFAESVIRSLAATRSTGGLEPSSVELRLEGRRVIYDYLVVQQGPDRFVFTAHSRVPHPSLPNEKLYQQIIESTLDRISLIDLDGTIRYMNPPDHRTSSWFELWDREDARKLRDEVNTAKNGGVGRFEAVFPSPSGTSKWCDIRIDPVIDDDGAIRQLLVVSQDITEQKSVAAKLARQEKFFRSFFENSHDYFFLLDLEGKVLYESRATNSESGRSRRSYFDNVHPEDADRVRESLLSVTSEEKYKTVEYRYRNGAGKWIHLEALWKIGIDGNEGPILVGNGRDVTERNRADEAIRESQQQFYSFLDNLPAAIWITDENGTFYYANPYCSNTLGRSPGELVGVPLHEIFPEDVADNFINSIKKAAAAGPTIEELDDLVTSPGNTGSFLIYRFPLLQPVNGQTLVGGVAINLTEQKRIGRALQESEQEYKRIVDTMIEGICVCDADMRIVFVNDQLVRMLGSTERDEVLGRPIMDLFDAEAQTRFGSYLESRHTGVGQNYTAGLIRHDGVPLTALISAAPVYDDQQEFAGSLALFIDITDRVEAERQLEALAGRLLTVQDEERRRIARELHDGTAQDLAAIALNLSMTSQRLGPSNADIVPVMDQTRQMAENSLRELRTLSYLLHPPMFDDGGLVSSLRWFIEGYSTRSGIDVAFYDSLESRLPSEIEIAIYRVVQESLNNVHRHSGSKTASISLAVKDNEVFVRIKDRGHGFGHDDPRYTNKNFTLLGVGLRGMEERLRMLGGRLTIGSGPKGTKITGIIPVPVKQ
jgi:PAS domain S-box-containing protein